MGLGPWLSGPCESKLRTTGPPRDMSHDCSWRPIWMIRVHTRALRCHHIRRCRLDPQRRQKQYITKSSHQNSAVPSHLALKFNSFFNTDKWASQTLKQRHLENHREGFTTQSHGNQHFGPRHFQQQRRRRSQQLSSKVKLSTRSVPVSGSYRRGREEISQTSRSKEVKNPELATDLTL